MTTTIDLETLESLLASNTNLTKSVAVMTELYQKADRERRELRNFLERLGFDPYEICRKASGEENGGSCKVVSMDSGR